MYFILWYFIIPKFCFRISCLVFMFLPWQMCCCHDCTSARILPFLNKNETVCHTAFCRMSWRVQANISNVVIVKELRTGRPIEVSVQTNSHTIHPRTVNDAHWNTCQRLLTTEFLGNHPIAILFPQLCTYANIRYIELWVVAWLYASWWCELNLMLYLLHVCGGSIATCGPQLDLWRFQEETWERTGGVLRFGVPISPCAALFATSRISLTVMFIYKQYRFIPDKLNVLMTAQTI
jgi:hypothetical protein